MTAALLFFVVAGALIFRRCQRVDRRLGRLLDLAEESRVARLRQLGAGDTYRVYGCGKILSVDYDRGELIVEKEAL